MPSSFYRDKVVIITGASSGIGKALALLLADQGAWLALAARRTERLEAVCAACRERGGKAIAITTDVSEQSRCEALIRKTVEAFGRIDALVNNAGISMWAKFQDVQTLEMFEKIMRTNYLGSVYCTYYALPFLKRTRGQIVGVSSLSGKNGIPTRSGYAASKHAMVGFFDTLRIELASSGVGVTMIYPDFVASEVRERAFGADGRPLGKSPVHEDEVMTADRCAWLIVDGMTKRKREVIMGFRGKIGLWLKLVAPGLVDRMALNAINRGR